ncbi:MAG: hypothetical protein MJH09_10770 [Cetobacterium sp.]|uniref:hypothetical protein n=1 Tax=Paraclostridium sordellii TaxID=1505 RepID=UPI000542B308|nr:hypothetical protein [Paeniclostridium sordellii]MCJ8343306.1 hypothetical protein [Cetobacterium sp.]CEK34552.1 hypothetical protein UMC2_37631 [[Clostridium] sordellii] [Paeniclostridium sordellii]
MNEYILRWQYGIFQEKVKIHYTYGHIDTLREKAKAIAKDDRVVFISIDKVEEVIKDTRTEKMMKYIENNTIK